MTHFAVTSLLLAVAALACGPLASLAEDSPNPCGAGTVTSASEGVMVEGKAAARAGDTEGSLLALPSLGEEEAFELGTFVCSWEECGLPATYFVGPFVTHGGLSPNAWNLRVDVLDAWTCTTDISQQWEVVSSVVRESFHLKLGESHGRPNTVGSTAS